MAARACRRAGAERRNGTFTQITRDKTAPPSSTTARPMPKDRNADRQRARRAVIGADGAMSSVAKQCIPGAKELPHVAAYHEIVRSPSRQPPAKHGFDATRCDVYYQGKLSPDFYAWIFPHGETTSIGVGTELKGFSLHDAVDQLRKETGLDQCETLRREGAPIPLHPLAKWDNGRDVVLAGDAAGVVAPASGEGIYYALVGGRLAGDAVEEMLITGNSQGAGPRPQALHEGPWTRVLVLGIMQKFWYKNDKRRERFVSLCADPDIQELTWQAYMHKRWSRPSRWRTCASS
jgi:geranylgeranyl reductase